MLQSLGSKHLEPHVRGLAAVLLRRVLILEEPTLWDCLQRTGGSGPNEGNGLDAGMEGSSGQRGLQVHLLRVLSDETDASVRRKVGTILDGNGKEGLSHHGHHFYLGLSGSHGRHISRTPGCMLMPTPPVMGGSEWAPI